MRVVLISGHDASSDRKTGFHFWAEILARRGIDVYFVTVGSSPISLLKKDGKQLKPPFNRWVPLADHIQKFTWLPIFHPLNFSKPWMNYLTWPLFSLYPDLMPQKLLEPLKSADYFVVENGAGQMLVPRLAKLNPKARFIFNSSDRPSVVKWHPIVVESERKMLPHIDMIRLNAAAMAEDFPEGVDTHYIPQAIDKKLFDAPTKNPYSGPKNAINVGDMIFDPKAVEVLAENFPDWTFHLFGKRAHTSKPMANVIEYQEMPFEKLVPYLQHADIGLAPYQDTPQAAYLGQSSLKMVQYTYCKMPIVAPQIAAGKRDNILSYSNSQDEQSVVNAFQSAKNFDRNTIDKSAVPSWEDVIDRMMTLAKEQSNTIKVIFLLTAQRGKKCAIGNYTLELTQSLKKSGIEPHIEWLDEWSFKTVNKIAKKYKGQKNLAFHVQYPSVGVGNSIVPAFLPLLLAPQPIYITLHEFSVFSILRKAIFLLPAMLAKNIVLTNEQERKVFKRFFPLAGRKSKVASSGENASLYRRHVKA